VLGFIGLSRLLVTYIQLTIGSLGALVRPRSQGDS